MKFKVEGTEWMEHFESLNDDERKVLLALSNDQYLWRTPEGITKATGLSDQQRDEIMKGLLEKNLVQPTISNDQRLLYGLKDRVSASKRRLR
ncbi:MAG: hypothetical protein AAGK14_07570 [Verrucomicrobiota bacterium]